MPVSTGDPLQPLVDARRAGRPLPSLTDLGGAAMLAEAHSALLDHNELPTLIRLVCDETAVLEGEVGRDFLLAAAEAPRHPLILEEVVASFLSHSDAIRVLSEDLVDVWLDISRSKLNLLGGIALEGSARLVLAEAASPYGLLDRLRRMRKELTRADDDFACRAVRVAGAVAEHFPAPEVPALLEDLLSRDDVADDAVFELGMLALRGALTADTFDHARAMLLQSRQNLSDAYCDEERPDAAAFGAAIDAVLVYGAGGTVSEDTVHRLQEAILEIRLNLLGLPPGWRTPRLNTLSAWQGLLDSLRRAQTADHPGSWLHAASVIRDLVDVYTTHRSLDLLAPSDGFLNTGTTNSEAATGLHAILAPRIEQTLLSREGGLALLDRWLEELGAASDDDDPTTPLVREQAIALRDVLAVKERDTRPKFDRPVVTLAGLPLTADETDHLSKMPDLAERLGVMWEARRAEIPVDEIPAVAAVYRGTLAELRRHCPDGYTGQFAADIDRMTLYLLRFLDLRLSETQKFGGDDRKYLQQLKKEDTKPLERELGKDLRDFLRGQGLRVELEVSNIGAGRVDLAWRPHDQLITLELKRDWKDPSWDAYAERFLPQAISYQTNGPAVNFLVVLDLTDKPDGLAAIFSCITVRTVPGPAGDPRPRTVIMIRIQGNKRDPSALKA